MIQFLYQRHAQCFVILTHMCCSIDRQFEFIVGDEKKKCAGLLHRFLEDKIIRGKAMLAEQCDAELPAVGGGFARVKDICTGLCRAGCEVVQCINKRDDQFLLTKKKKPCDTRFQKKSIQKRKQLCKEKINIFNIEDNKFIKNRQTPKRICPLYCDNPCKKKLAQE